MRVPVRRLTRQESQEDLALAVLDLAADTLAGIKQRLDAPL